MKVIITIPVTEEQKKKYAELKDAEILFADGMTLTEEIVRDAEVIMGNIPHSLVEKCEKLRWLQLQSAGANRYTDIPEDVILTNCAGAFGTAMSEHMMAFVLMAMKRLEDYYEDQKNCIWKRLGAVGTIVGSTVLCIGMGNIGGELAKRMKAFDAYVIGVQRAAHEKPAFVDELHTIEELDELLPRADIVTLSVPHTDKTVHMIDERRLRLMKKNAILVNVGRGTAIVTDDLVRVLNEGHLAAACLDVTDPEPLPADHPLWKARNVFITPHVSAGDGTNVTVGNVSDIFYVNLRHYVNNEPLEHVVNKKQGY
ncbi:MAG: D-2-hydroxyacid dehydrogenase [Erysipelotrichaceae bacterium]|nr:D-2-hydroxyacid dehydrogenase [Erysipelotrichaceae bacterium]